MVEPAFNQMQVQHGIGSRVSQRRPHAAAPGSRHHHGRRDPRPRDGRDGRAGGAHRPPRALDAAHERRAVGVTRLLDLGVPPYLLHSTMLGVMAQRLVRTLCPHCKGGVRHGQARRRRAELLVRHRPRLRLPRVYGETDGERRSATRSTSQRLGPARLIQLLAATRSTGSCSASTCACGRSATRAARAVASTRWRTTPAQGRDWERYAWIKARRWPATSPPASVCRGAAAVRLPALPRLRRVRRPARDEGADRAARCAARSWPITSSSARAASARSSSSCRPSS
jgi:hypothetical protein